MTRPRRISIFILSLVSSILLATTGATTAAAQGGLKLERDSVPLFRGFAVSFDLLGAGQMLLSDYGQYEGALRLNLRDQYFPIVEVGYGRADHEDDEVTGVTYKTSAPYFRIGIDFNLMKNKHSVNRIYGGLRYGFTIYKVDISRQPFPDPVWQWDTSYGLNGESCHQHWAEAVFGIDAQVLGPLHLGWSVRYRRRLAHDDGVMGKTWYVPGYGTQNRSRLGGTFNISIDI